MIFSHDIPPQRVEIPDRSIGYMIHHRIGCLLSPEDRVFQLAFYGHIEDPFTQRGIGKCVRESRLDTPWIH